MGDKVDALFAYRSNAVDLGLPYISLPPQIDLSQPRLARRYAQVSYTNADGVTFRGGPIYASATVLERSAHPQTAIDFVKLLGPILSARPGRRTASSQCWPASTGDRSARRRIAAAVGRGLRR